jgi:hypothetical protein
MEEQQVLAERLAGRFGWKAAGDLAVAESTVFSLDRDDYDLTVAALGDLGVKNNRKREVPEFEEVAVTTYPLATYLGAHVARGDQPELTFQVPATKGSVRSNGLYKLIESFDKGQEYGTYVWRELWDRLGDADLRGGEAALSAGILLNDTTKPSDRTQPANGYDEAGLVHANHTVPEQRAAIEKEKSTAKQAGVNLDPIAITEYLVTQAKRRRAGLPLLDKPTVTRFVQYPEQNIVGGVYVLGAIVDGDSRLDLGGSSVDDTWGGYGVRRVVRVA